MFFIKRNRRASKSSHEVHSCRTNWLGQNQVVSLLYMIVFGEMAQSEIEPFLAKTSPL